jgi:hypothetical protein
MLSVRPIAAGASTLAAALSFSYAEPASGDDLVSGRALGRPGLGAGKLASPPPEDVQQSLISVAETKPVGSDATSSLGTYFENWSARVDEAKKSQPHWLPPLMTTSPLITQLVRVDGSYQWQGNGARTFNLGGTKGLFLVPAKTIEVDFDFPNYQERYHIQPAAGLTDYQFLLVKQRLLSANDQEGSYILTAALAAQAPISGSPFTNNAFVITPTLAGGKGFGDLNIQAATSLAIPTAHQDTLGTAWLTNVTFQYRLGGLLWPEFEVNWTHWLNGTQRAGLNQVFLTVGALFGPIPINQRVGIVIGGGLQFAVAPSVTLEPVLTPAYQTALVFSARLSF